MGKQMRSYEVQIKDWEKFRAIYAGYSAGQVRWRNVSSAKESGYSVSLADFRVVRAYQYDDLAKSHTGMRGPICLGWIDDGDSWGVLKNPAQED